MPGEAVKYTLMTKTHTEATRDWRIDIESLCASSYGTGYRHISTPFSSLYEKMAYEFRENTVLYSKIHNEVFAN